MKKKALLLGFLVAASILSFSGCKNFPSTEEVNPEVQETEAPAETEITEDEPEEDITEAEKSAEYDYSEIYGEFTKELYDIIVSGEETDDEEYMWLTDIVASMDTKDVLAGTGYTVMDMSGDDIPELIIGSVGDDNKGETVYAVYTCTEGKVKSVFSGWYRNSYSILDDGSFLNSGSVSAATGVFGRYLLSSDGTELICQENYFSDIADDESMKTAFYSNTTGDTDASSSEELDITEEEFYEKEEIMRTHIVSMEYTPFSSLAPVSSVCAITAEYAENELPEGCEEYRTYTEDISSNTVFTATEDVTDFSIAALSLRDSENMIFAAMKLFTTEKLEAGQSVAAGLGYLGTIPNNGIIYTDKDGNSHTYAVTQSGEDGSLILMEINEEGKLAE